MKAPISQLVFCWIHSYLKSVDIATLARESPIKLGWLENYFWALQRLARLYFLLLKMLLRHAVPWQRNNRLTGARNCRVPSVVHGIFTSRQVPRNLLGTALLEQLLWVPGKSVNQAICVHSAVGAPREWRGRGREELSHCFIPLHPPHPTQAYGSIRNGNEFGSIETSPLELNSSYTIRYSVSNNTVMRWLEERFAALDGHAGLIYLWRQPVSLNPALSELHRMSPLYHSAHRSSLLGAHLLHLSVDLQVEEYEPESQ